MAKTLLISVLVSVEFHLTHLLSEKYLENDSSEGCCRLRRTLRTALPPYAKLQFCQRHSLESLLNARHRASVYAMYANRVNRKKIPSFPLEEYGRPSVLQRSRLPILIHVLHGPRDVRRNGFL